MHDDDRIRSEQAGISWMNADAQGGGSSPPAVGRVPDSPYQLRLLLPPDERLPPSLSTVSAGVQLQRASRLEALPSPWDGLCLTQRWLDEIGGPGDRALVALASLTAPVWILGAQRRPGSLSAVCNPLVGALGTSWGRARVVERMVRARHGRQWLGALGEGERYASVYTHLAEVPVSPEVGVVSHYELQSRVAAEVRWAQGERSVLSALVVEVRWEGGGRADLPVETAEVMDTLVRGALRDTDVVGRLDHQVYLVLLPGQSPEEAMVPARRLLGLDLNQALPAGTPRVALAVGVSGRRRCPVDGLALVREADLAIRALTSSAEPLVFDPDGEAPWTASAPLDDAVLRPGARVVDALPGLFRAPIPDRQLERVLRAVQASLPGFDIERGLRLARYGDLIARLLGTLDMHARRLLWRCSLLHGLGDALREAGAAGGEAASWQAPFRRIADVSPALRLETRILIDAHRHLFGAGGSRLRRRGASYQIARVLEVADAWLRLAFEAGAGMAAPAGPPEADAAAAGPSLALIRDNLAAGAAWRYDKETVEVFLQWLSVNGESELAP